MVPALLKLKLRKRTPAAPPAEDVISDVIQPPGSPAFDLTQPPIESTTSLPTPCRPPPRSYAQLTDTAPPPSCGPPPRSYAQLTDTAHELVAASWDPNLSIRQWLDAVRELASEAQESFRRNDLETAFIRAETVLKLLQDVLPRHHPRWRTAEPEQLATARRQFAEIGPLHTSLRHRLLERTAQYYAHVTSANPAPAANRASPALMLRNTISAAAGVYTDSSAPSATRGDPFGKARTSAKPVQAGPPRVNRLRQAAISGLARPTGATSLPEPGMDDPEGDGSLDRGVLDGLGQEGSGPTAEDPLALRREGRRIPRLADTVAHLATSTAPKHTRALAPHHYYSDHAKPSAPLALPGESDSDGEGRQNYYRGALSPQPPPAAPTPLHQVSDPPLLGRMPNGFPVPPIPPTPPSFLVLSATSHLPTMTPLPTPPVPPVPLSFTHNVITVSTPLASPHSDTAISYVSPPARIASPAASTTNGSGPDGLDSLKHSLDNSTVPASVLEVAPQAGSEPERDPPFSKTDETRSGGQLRRVILPAKLISHFIDVIAEDNTARKIETCGLLLGKERDDELVISHLLIPQQCGTSETCSMQLEEEVAAFQQQENLLTFGWIHTHPTQSIFLSSLDLHTHASYQRLLPEAIAVVCAPHEGPDAYGVFRMTDPPGLEIVLECQDEGAFHPHPQLPLYTDVDQEGGHCLVREEPFQCVDLR